MSENSQNGNGNGSGKRFGLAYSNQISLGNIIQILVLFITIVLGLNNLKDDLLKSINDNTKAINSNTAEIRVIQTEVKNNGERLNKVEDRTGLGYQKGNPLR